MDEELNENNEISDNDDDENAKTSIMVMGDDKGDSNSSFLVSSKIDNEEDDEDISLNKKGKTCNKACDEHKKIQEWYLQVLFSLSLLFSFGNVSKKTNHIGWVKYQYKRRN